MNQIIESALSLLNDGWSVERIREYLRGNYIDATCSAVEEAIGTAQQRMKADDLQVERHESDDELGRLYYSDVLDEYGRRLC